MNCESLVTPELEPQPKVLLACDLDGSLFQGPNSWVSISKKIINGWEKLQHPSITSTFKSNSLTNEHRFAKHVLEFLSHSTRHINEDIYFTLSLLKSYSDYQEFPLDMAVTSGRNQNTLGAFTATKLEDLGLNVYFKNRQFLKPDNCESWQSKFNQLQKLIQENSYTHAFLFENNPVSAKLIAKLAKQQNLPIHILLHEGRLETSPPVLSVLGLDQKILADSNIHLTSIKQIPQIIHFVLFPQPNPQI